MSVVGARGRMPRCGRRRGRLLVAAALIAIVAAGTTAEPVSAGTYEVLQCGAANRGFDDARFERTHGGDYRFRKYCSEAAGEHSLQVENFSSAPRGRQGEISYSAPEGLAIAAVRLEAKLRRDGNQRSRLVFYDSAGAEAGRIASGGSDAAPFRTYSRSFAGAGRRAIGAQLVCDGASSCPQSDRAKTWIRELSLTFADTVAPQLAPSGSLLAGGWVRGSRELAVAASDRGSGLTSITTTVGGEATGVGAFFDCARLAGARASRIVPCAGSRRLAGALDTTRPPFVNGANRLVICAADFGREANRPCQSRTVLVDNAPPVAQFEAERDPDDPELIRALVGDAHSGVAAARIAFRPRAGGGWIELPTERSGAVASARVDSSAYPPGRYLFRVIVADAAGNVFGTTSRRGGGALELDFPLKTATRLRAGLDGSKRRGYRSRPTYSGVLTDDDGAPVAGEKVVVSQSFARGSERESKPLVARSGGRGRFELELDRGPSRRLSASYAGSRRYQPSSSRPDRLSVGGSAKLRVGKRRVRAGRKARFRGRVGTLGVAPEAARKLVELQAREVGERRFRTVREAFRAGAGGRWRMSYRFGRFYTRPVRFEFRLKLSRESGWPYRGPAYSKRKRLVVLPRR